MQRLRLKTKIEKNALWLEIKWLLVVFTTPFDSLHAFELILPWGQCKANRARETTSKLANY